jgi:iron complex outermembrane receptor protein
MQSQRHTAPRLRAVAFACQLVCLSAAYAQTSMESTESANKVTITGGKVGMGLMVQEEVPKARSTISEDEIRKQRSTGNVFQSMELMPAVNSYNYDATGLFGGGLTMRGFNSDQIGATINGVPVNDSGNFAVFPQEYADNENICQEFVTQGSTDVESPHVGATGGNIGIVTCAPLNERRVRVAQTVGQLNLSRTFVRYDTGLWDDKRSKMFISYSHTQADKWKGPGEAKRDHIDFGFNWDADRFNYVHTAILYNKAKNNNINNLTLSDLNANGYYFDYASTFAGHLTPVNGTAQKETNTNPAYYKLSINPFENIVASATIAARVGDNLDVKVVPYFWYGYGTGGIQQKVIAENAFYNGAGKNNAAVDLNGDGDTLDTILVAGSSVTHTQRPGVTGSIKYQLGDHELFTGVWYERAKHRQTGPAVAVDANGNMADDWLRSDWIRRPDGSPYESRDWNTISTAYQFFAQDTISAMSDKLLVNFGVRTPHIERDFTNYASEAAPGYYHYTRTFSSVLPQFGVRYRINNDNQLFASLAKNMKAPPNFVFATTSNVAISNGAVSLLGLPEPETSWNMDLGYRHQDNLLTAQASLYFIDFKNRQTTAFDAVTQKSIFVNAGRVKSQGIELEAGNTPIKGWSFYGSFSYDHSEIQDDFPTSSGALPTSGKEFPQAPKFKVGLSAQYETKDWYARIKARHVGRQWATLANDEEVPSYNVADFDAGYQFPNMGIAKNITLRFNISNLFNAQYRNPSTYLPNSTVINGIASAGSVRYYLGAPRFTSLTLQADF